VARLFRRVLGSCHWLPACSRPFLPTSGVSIMGTDFAMLLAGVDTGLQGSSLPVLEATATSDRATELLLALPLPCGRPARQGL
jgi:hypothetical protein